MHRSPSLCTSCRGARSGAGGAGGRGGGAGRRGARGWARGRGRAGARWGAGVRGGWGTRVAQRMTRAGCRGTRAALITVSHLVKCYGAHVVVDDVSFEVGKGEVVGFLGPNGAGKSTTLRILAGFLGPTAGKVTIAGHDVIDEPFQARRSMGYIPEAGPL